MKWLNCTKIRLILVGFVVAVVLSGGRAKADFAFGEPTLVPNVNSSSAGAYYPSISSDGLTLYFGSGSDFLDGRKGIDLWVSTRKTTEDEWGEPVNLGPPVNSSGNENCPNISADGLTLYFSDYGLTALDFGSSGFRPGGFGGCDIWMTMRATTEDDWGEPMNIGPTANSVAHELTPEISANGLALYFASNRPGGLGDHDLWMATWATTHDDWTTPVNLGPIVNRGSWDGKLDISSNGCTLFFSSNRGGVGWETWMTTWATVLNDWTTPVLLPINTSYEEASTSLSADGRTLYFSSTRPGGPGGWNLWQAPIQPIVDFNGDEIVDIDDLLILIDLWGTSERLCDIGPTPLGDGIVDMKDLEVFMSYWEQENMPEITEDIE